MKVGDKVRFTTDSTHEVFTVRAVSPDAVMIQIAEIGFWFYTDFLTVIDPELDQSFARLAAFTLEPDQPTDDDIVTEQLKFLEI